MSSPDPLPTFRDPAGSLRLTPDAALRDIHLDHAEALLAFLASPLCATLVETQRLIPATILATQPLLQLQHPLIPFITYPWEWPVSLWHAAARHTLTLALDLLDHDLLLKDATPLNILFYGVQPILVDLPSIAPANLASSLWPAYAQFVRTFLLPPLANRALGWPLAATLLRRDGLEPEELYPHLSWLQRLSRPALSLVTLPTRLARRGAATPAPAPPVTDPELARFTLRRTLNGLLHSLDRLAPPPSSSNWSAYTTTATHYSAENHAAKQSFLATALNAIAPARVLDVGANTGVYSLLAAEAGAHVVSLEPDPAALDSLVARIQATAHKRAITPVLGSLAQPTPATGWNNREHLSFLQRAQGSFDCVLMLAVLHHLLLADQVPLPAIAALAASLTTRHLILEWVPPSDPMFQQLLRGRDDLYAHLTESALRDALAPHFHTVAQCRLGNQRLLLHLQRID